MLISKLQHFFPTVAGVCLFMFSVAAPARNNPAVPKWQRFELTLKSSVNYSDPLQEAEVRAIFVSPLGETNRVYGFWDGGKTWRVRYQPNFPGRWTYYTMCSDPANQGLNGQTGEFLCIAARGNSRFDTHGPIQVARDQQHLQHADRSPFLWLGDAAGLAAIKSTPTDWEHYVQTRATQKFNVVQWQLTAPGLDAKQTAFTGQTRLSLNLKMFRQLDAKILAANRAGLLSAIAPLWEIGDHPGELLPEEQAIRLFRYALARWGADQVAWIVAFESDSTGASATRWQNIGRAVFNQVTHAPVILLPGESIWVLDAFRSEKWVKALGLQTATVTDENSLPWLLNGPLAFERQKTPARPLITIAPPAEQAGPARTGSITSDFSRRLMWWSVLLNSPAGVSYCADDVAVWNHLPGAAKNLPPWRAALTLPGAEAIAPLASTLGATDSGRLELIPSALNASSDQPTHHRVAGVCTESRDLILFYTAEAEPVNVARPTISPGGQATWIDPRTGESRVANHTETVTAWRFTPPGPGDWLLVLKARR